LSTAPEKKTAMSTSGPHELVAAFTELILQIRQPSILWPAMLEHLEEEIGFDSGYIAASWGTAMEGRGAIIGHAEPFLKRNLGRLLAEIAPEELAGYADRARRHDEIWGPARRAELAVFNEVLDPAGVKNMLVRVSCRNGNVAGFNLERQGTSSRFSDQELALVDMVAPFLHIVEVLTLVADENGDESRQTGMFALEHGLSKREAEFLDLTIRGLQNGEIAMLTGVSINTVRNTLVKVFEKAGVTNRAELTYVATRHHADGRIVPGATRSTTPSPPTRPDDGLRAFAKRVAEVSRVQPVRLLHAPIRVTPPSGHIVYTSPLAPEVVRASTMGAGSRTIGR
jgi:DNA-binding CsgD family transcriptional regulator